MADHFSGWCVELQATSCVLSVIAGFMVTAVASEVDMTFWAWTGRWNWFLSWWLYEAVCCSGVWCEREGGVHWENKEGEQERVEREREREGAYVDDWSGSGERISIHLCFLADCTWALLPRHQWELPFVNDGKLPFFFNLNCLFHIYLLSHFYFLKLNQLWFFSNLFLLYRE